MIKENFDKILTKVDNAKERREDLAGRFNGLMDGDPDCKDEDEFKLGQSLDAIDAIMVEACNQLRVPRQFLEDALDGCVVNRWELYNSVILNRRVK